MVTGGNRWVLLLAEQLGGAVRPAEQQQQQRLQPAASSPALFGEVGPLLDDWEKYLTGLAEDLVEDHTDLRSAVTPSASLTQENSLFVQVGGEHRSQVLKQLSAIR